MTGPGRGRCYCSFPDKGTKEIRREFAGCVALYSMLNIHFNVLPDRVSRDKNCQL